MARVGRFGNLPGRAPDLTNTIVALMEQYESARDRNILSAWMNGGKFEGKKVTDGRIRNWFKMRRSQYGKDDPEYDYWDQQLDQIDYQIGESKMLLRFEQGGIKESGAAAWYVSNAKRFPKNSEAWREAMRNAARFKKAAQEKARASRTVSDSEKYNNEVNQIRRRHIAPAEAAMRILDRAVRKSGLQPVKGQGFMDLDITGMIGDDTLREFMRSKEGREFANRWESATGERFSYKSLRQIINGARQGARKAAQVARKYGYESYVPSWESQARQWSEVGTNLNVFSSDIADRYSSKAGAYYVAYGQETTAEGRKELRTNYARYLEREIKKADKTGDDVLSGALRNELRALRGEDPVANANPLAFGGGSSGEGVAQTLFEIQYDENGAPKYVGLQQPSVEEQQRADALRDDEIIASHKAKDGVWGYTTDPETGLRTDINIEEARGDARSNRDAGFMTNYENGVPFLISYEELTYTDPGTGKTLPYPNGYTYTDINGQVRYIYPGPTGEEVNSSEPPFDVTSWDDPDGRTGPGEIWVDGIGPVPIWEQDGANFKFADAYVQTVLVPLAQQATGTQDTATVNAALGQVAAANLQGFGQEEAPTLNLQVDAETGLPLTPAQIEERQQATVQTETVTDEETGEEVTRNVETGEDLKPGDPFVMEVAERLGIPANEVTEQMGDAILSASNNMLGGGSPQQREMAWNEADDETKAAWAESIGTGSNVMADGEVNRSSFPLGDETDVFGEAEYEPGDVPLESEVASTQQSATEQAGIETISVEPLWVINDTGTTTDRSGVLAQYYSPQGRMQLARMSPEERLATVQTAMIADGLDPENPYQLRTYTEEVDVLVAAGETGEWEYITAYGAAAPENKDDAIGWNMTYRNVVDANAAPGVSLTKFAGVEGPAFVRALREAGWTDQQIKEEGYEDDLDALETLEREQTYGPSTFTGEPGDYSFEGGSEQSTTLDAGSAVDAVVPGQRRGGQLELRAAIAGVVAGSNVPDPALAQARAGRAGAFRGNPAIMDPRMIAQAAGSAAVGLPKMKTKSITNPTYDPLSSVQAPAAPAPAPVESDGGFKFPWEPGGFFNQTTKPADVSANTPKAPKYDPLSSVQAPISSTPVKPEKTSYTWDGPSGYEEKGDYSWE